MGVASCCCFARVSQRFALIVPMFIHGLAHFPKEDWFPLKNVMFRVYVNLQEGSYNGDSWGKYMIIIILSP